MKPQKRITILYDSCNLSKSHTNYEDEFPLSNHSHYYQIDRIMHVSNQKLARQDLIMQRKDKSFTRERLAIISLSKKISRLQSIDMSTPNTCLNSNSDPKINNENDIVDDLMKICEFNLSSCLSPCQTSNVTEKEHIAFNQPVDSFQASSFTSNSAAGTFKEMESINEQQIYLSLFDIFQDSLESTCSKRSCDSNYGSHTVKRRLISTI